MSTDRSSAQAASDHRATAPATRSAQMLRVASLRRLGVRVAVAATATAHHPAAHPEAAPKAPAACGAVATACGTAAGHGRARSLR